jgi:hypothetical protein
MRAFLLRHTADLLQQPQEIGLAAFFDFLPVRKTVEVHGLHLDRFPSLRYTKECAQVRSPHREARSYLVAFGDQLLQRPLDVGKALQERRNTRQVKSTPRLTNHWRVSRKQL